MGDRTAIEWTDATWNPLVGCSKVSPGCDHCYAVGVTHRGMAPQHRGLTVVTDDGVDWNGQINQAPESVLLKPLHWQRPRRIFVNSLSDLFHPAVDDLMIAKVVAVMSLAPQHTFQVLTKRPKAMQAVLSSDEFWAKVALERRHVAPTRAALDQHALLIRPLANVWWGVSIESNRYAFRADHLRDTPAAVRWVSAEPLLGPLDQLDLTGIDWVVAGGESGPGARPMHPDWVRDLRDRCAVGVECATCRGQGLIEAPLRGWVPEVLRMPTAHRGSLRGTGRQPVAFHFKQAGSVLAAEWGMSDRKGGSIDEMPAEFRVREYPDAR